MRPEPVERVPSDVDPRDFRPDSPDLHRDLVGLRHLAMALVGAHDAEDLLQDAACVTLRTGSPPHSPVAFLRGVLRNLAGKRYRARARRGRHEPEAARIGDGSAPAAVDVAAHSESIRRMSNALAALPEPFREALLLRYFSALSPAEIAARLGVPAATVKSRLQRGLATLRERMGADGGRDWRGGLLVALGVEPRIARPSSLLLVPVVAVVGGLLVIVSALLSWSDTAPLPAAPVASVEVAAEAGRSSSGVASAAMPEQLRVSASPDGPPTAPARLWRAAGRCVDDGGQPLAGLAVRVAHDRTDRGGLPQPSDLVYASTATALDGTFSIGVDRRPLPLRLEVQVHDHWIRTVGLGPELGDFDCGEVVVARTVALRGRIVDRRDRPRAAAIVQIASDGWQLGLVLPVHADDDGRFAVSLPPGDYHCNVVGELPIERRNDVVTLGPEGLELLLRVEAAANLATVAGIVVGPDGAPLADAEVTAQDRGGNRFVVRTGGDGRFVVRNCRPWPIGPLDFTVRHEACDIAYLPQFADWGMSGVHIVLQPLASIELQVIGADGGPIDGVTVRARQLVEFDRRKHPGFPVCAVEPLGEGLVRVNGLCRGRNQLLVESDGGRAAGKLTSIDVVDGARLHIELPARVRRLLRLRFADGTPAAGCIVELQDGKFGASVTAQGPDEYAAVTTGPRALLLQSVVTDTQGEAMLDGPADGDLTVMVMGGACQHLSQQCVSLVEEGALELVVRGVGALRVRLEPVSLLPRFGDDLRVATCVPDARSRGIGGARTVSRDGEVVFERLPAEVDAMLFVALGGTVRDLRLVRAAREAANEVTVDISALLPGVLIGRVCDADGDPRTVRGPRLQWRRVDGEWLDCQVRLEVDTDGKFRVRGLPGHYRLQWTELLPVARQVLAEPEFDLLSDRETVVTFQDGG